MVVSRNKEKVYYLIRWLTILLSLVFIVTRNLGSITQSSMNDFKVVHNLYFQLWHTLVDLMLSTTVYKLSVLEMFNISRSTQLEIFLASIIMHY